MDFLLSTMLCVGGVAMVLLGFTYYMMYRTNQVHNALMRLLDEHYYSICFHLKSFNGDITKMYDHMLFRIDKPVSWFFKKYSVIEPSTNIPVNK